jgi:hypothetical protein
VQARVTSRTVGPSSSRERRYGWRVSSPLISDAELSSLLGTVTVLDVRYRLGGPPGREEYAAGHVPGAAYVDMQSSRAHPATPWTGAVGIRYPHRTCSWRPCGGPG